MIYWRSGRHAPLSCSVTAGVLIRVTMLLLSAGTGLVWTYSEQNYFSFFLSALWNGESPTRFSPLCYSRAFLEDINSFHPPPNSMP